MSRLSAISQRHRSAFSALSSTASDFSNVPFQDTKCVLITKRLVKIGLWLFRASSAFRACPYHVGKTVPTLRMTNSKLALFIWKTNMCFSYGFTAFVLVRSLAQYIRGISTLEIAYACYLSVIFAIGSFGMIPITFYPRDYGYTITLAFRFYMDFQETFVKYNAKPPGIVRLNEKAVVMVFLTFIESNTLIALSAAVLPNSPASVTSALKDIGLYESSNNFGWILIEKTFDVLLINQTLTIVTLVCMHCVMLLPYFCFPSMIILKEMRTPMLTQSWTSVMKHMDTFEDLRFLTNSLSYMFTTAIAGVQFLTMCGAVFGSFVGMRYGGIIGAGALISAFVCLVVLLMLYRGIASFGEESNRALEFWKRDPQKLSELEKHRLQYMKPLRYYVGNFYFIDRGIIVTIVQIVTDNVLNAMLMT